MAWTRFENRDRCPSCRGVLDTGTPDMYCCTRCGDEWSPETLCTLMFDGDLAVGVGDTVVFWRYKPTNTLKGEVVKVNRKTLAVQLVSVGFGQIDPPMRWITPVRPNHILAIEYR